MVVVKKALTFVAGIVLAAVMVGVPSGSAFAANASEIGAVQVGSIPAGVAISPDGTVAYVSNTSVSGTISVINVATRTLTTTISVGSRPYGIAFTPNGSQAYVVNRDSGSVSVIDVATNTVVGSQIPVGGQPYGITMSLDGSRAYVANSNDDTVSVISTATRTVTNTISVGDKPLYLATNPVSGDVYVTNMDGESLTKIVGTAVSGSALSVIGAYSVDVTPDGSKIFVGSINQSGYFAVVSASSFTQTGTISTSSNYYGFDISPDGQFLYFPNVNNDSVNRINVATQTVVTGDGYPLVLTQNDASNLEITPDCTMALVVTPNYPSGAGQGYLTFVSTGMPDCTPPAPAPAPSPDPALAATGSLEPQAFGVLGAFALGAIASGLLILRIKRTRS